MRCPNCGVANTPTARFCSNCGAALVQYAPPARRGTSCGWLAFLLLLIPLLGLIALVCVAGVVIYLDPDWLPFDLPIDLPGGGQPVATGGQVQQVVGPAGADFACPGGANMSVPAGALAQDTPITVTQLIASPPFPVEYLASPAGPAYEVTVPENCELQQLVELELPLQRQEGVDASLYTVYAWDGALWWDVGGAVDEDSIHVQVPHFTVFQPALGYLPRRPVDFRNSGPYHAVIIPWTYLPPSASAPAPPPEVSTVSFAPPEGPNSSRFMSLPIGAYTFCIHYEKGDSGFWHYIRTQPETLTENDSTDLSFARVVNFATEHPNEERGRCGTAPLSTAGASAANAPGTGGSVDWTGFPFRPVGFVNNGPYNATVMPWTYIPAGSTDFVPVPDASTASFAPTAPGLWPNSSRFLSLPIGRYTWCMEWTDGRDENDDQYFDYYHWIDPREVTLDENDSTDLTFAEEVRFGTDQATPGGCDNPPYGVAGSATGAGGVQIIPGAGQVTIRLTWATTDDLDLHVTEPNGEEIWYQNRASDTGGALDVDANAGCSDTTTAPVENVFWTRGSAPLGEYRVRVHVYADCDDVPPVAFRLRIVVDGQVVFDATQTLAGQGDDFTFAFDRPVR